MTANLRSHGNGSVVSHVVRGDVVRSKEIKLYEYIVIVDEKQILNTYGSFSGDLVNLLPEILLTRGRLLLFMWVGYNELSPLIRTVLYEPHRSLH